MNRKLAKFSLRLPEIRLKESNLSLHPFHVMVRKELADHIGSWRTNILLFLVALTCSASIYAVFNGLNRNSAPTDNLFLQLFIASDGIVPSFIIFTGFIGPLLGIGLGFDAIQSERSRGTLSRTMAQPIPRDYIINAKFVASLLLISVLFLAMGFIVMGLGILLLGILPTPEQFVRMLLFLFVLIVYVAFWLNVSILFSVRLRSAATSALSALGLWMLFTVFYPIFVSMIGGAMMRSSELSAIQWTQALNRINPSSLFQEATSTLLVPEIRTTAGFLTMEQTVNAIPSPLPLGQSILLVWPQLTALIAATLLCFGIAVVLFMRQEIRSR